jgi:CBS domain containing-hemolysin-like protein
MRFRNYKAKDVMTPRTVVVSAPQTMTARDFYNMQDDLVFSRVPLRESQNEEAIVGYILKDEVLEHLIDDETDKPLQEFRRDVLYVPEIYSIFQLFNDFIKQREHVAIVVNEYGDMEGLVTMEDIVETLLGAEIVDETDKIVDLQEMAKSRWKTRFKKISALQNDNKASMSSNR